MVVRRIAYVTLLAVPLAGCFGDKFTSTNTTTIQQNSLRSANAYPILIDPRLKPEVNETRSGVNFWGDSTQRVVTTIPVL